MTVIKTGPPGLSPEAIRRALSMCGHLVKEGKSPSVAYAMVGTLQHKKSDSGDWIMLSVPNAIVRGCFQAMDEPGIELPPGEPLEAHISVIRPNELAAIGGPDKVTERGKQFRYRLGGLESVAPAGWPEVSRVWMLRVYSTELQALRKSYGLPPRPQNSEFDFHISVAIRRKGVLGRNDKSKTASEPAA